jgi:hypothetical protein
MPPLVRGGAMVLSDGDVRLRLADGATTYYRVTPVVGWRAGPTYPFTPSSLTLRIYSASLAARDAALAAAGLPADTPIGLFDLTATVKLALGRKTGGDAIRAVAKAAAVLAVERYLDRVTAPSPSLRVVTLAAAAG